MVAVIDPLSGIVNMVDTVLSRVEAREAKLRERVDIRDALLDLHHLLRVWLEAAWATNNLVYQLSAGATLERKKVHDVVVSQIAHAVDVAELIGLKLAPEMERRSGRARATVTDVLSIYTPEFESFFLETVRERLELIERVRQEIRPRSRPDRAIRALLGKKEPIPQLIRSLDRWPLGQSLNNLYQANERLASFIREKFEVSDLSVGT